MKTKHVLEAADVKLIAAAAEAEALKNHWAVTIAIVDDGGHLLGLQRLDGAPPFSAHMAPAKANTAALGRRESKIYEDVINGGRVAFLSAPDLHGLLEGGVEGETGDGVGSVTGFASAETDPMYDQAVEIVLKNKRASISLVQRHLRIGYNRAARLLEQMENSGIVSTMQSNGNREILVPTTQQEG